MLVLKRKNNETIIMTIQEGLEVGTKIEVSVSDIGFGEVKVGIDAPKEVVIVRKELLNRAYGRNHKAY